MASHKAFTIAEWAVVLALAASAFAVSELIGLTPKWEDGIVYTVVVFAVVVAALRSLWHRAVFWKGLTLAFMGHTIVLVVAIQALPPWRYGLPKLLLIPIGGLEGVFIAAIVRRRMAVQKSSRS